MPCEYLFSKYPLQTGWPCLIKVINHLIFPHPSQLSFCLYSGSPMVTVLSSIAAQPIKNRLYLVWRKLSPAHLSLSLDSSTVPYSTVACDLGILLDSELTMKQHISKVTSICYYHLRRLRQIRNYVSWEIMIQLVMSLVISRLDYCNSVLVGLPASTLAPLQRVQNAAARLILSLSDIVLSNSMASNKIPNHFQSR